MITFLLVIAAFFIGFGLNRAYVEGVSGAVSSASVGVAILTVVAAHLLSRFRERIASYEITFAHMSGICRASEKIASVVEASMIKDLNGRGFLKLMPSTEIYGVCSEELLDIYRERTSGLALGKLGDSNSVIAVMEFQLHLDLFVEYVKKYIHMRDSVLSMADGDLEEIKEEFDRCLCSGLIDEANYQKTLYNKVTKGYYNIICQSVLLQYEFLKKQSRTVEAEMRQVRLKLS